MKIGIRELMLKREREKQNAKPRKTWHERHGLVTRMAEEILVGKTRKAQRIQAKVFLKDPLKFNSQNIGRSITKRGIVI